MEVGVYNFNYDFKSRPQEIRLINFEHYFMFELGGCVWVG
jgi:hypothetical protein